MCLFTSAALAFAAASRLLSGCGERGYSSSRCAVFSPLTPAAERRLQGVQAIQQAGDGSVWSRRRAGLRAIGGFPGEAWSGSQLCSSVMDHQGRGRSASSCLKMGVNAPSNQESPGVLGQPSRELISDSGDIPRAACAVTTS